MRQGTEDSFQWESSTVDDINYHLNSPTMDSHADNSLKIQYPHSPASSVCSDRSTPSPDSGLEFQQSQSSESNFLQLRSGDNGIRRKISTSSDASYVSANLSCDECLSDRPVTPDELCPPSNKYDDIIEKIGDLKFSPRNSNLSLNDPEITVNIVDGEKEEGEVDDENNDDDDLQERGPDPKPKHMRKKPYASVDDWVLDTTAQKLLTEFSDMLNPCLDQLTDYSDGQRNDVNNEWIGNNIENGNANSNSDERSIPSIPSITLNEDSLHDEEHLMNSIGQQKFQAAQTEFCNPNPSPATSSENWPDSPASSYNVVSSRSHSRASSRAQSPGSLGNLGSPQVPISIAGSPPHQRLLQFRQPRPQSSSSSSNHSFGDTPSPQNYHLSIDQRIEDQLGMQFGNFKPWCESFESSSTIVNSSDTVDINIQMMNEVIRDNLEQDEMQVVPKFKNDTMTCRMPNKSFDKTNHNLPNQMCNTNVVSNLANTGTLINSAQNNLIYTDCNYTFNQNFSDNIQGNLHNQQDYASPEAVADLEVELEEILARSYSESSHAHSQLCHNQSPDVNTIQQNYIQAIEHVPQMQIQQHYDAQRFNNFSQPSTSTFDNFTIPKPVAQHKPTSRKNSLRSISPWPSLNLPATNASEILKAQLDSKEVEKAMKNVLGKKNEELTAVDGDGYTQLMCLVGNPEEFHMMKAYLIPLVERLGTIPDGLTKTNNRGEDALYLAAMNCPQMPYIAGYLAAVMLQKGIDVSQRLYQTRGDTLIHAVAAHGESHKSVLAELLSLRTIQGNSVFDLSKRNYDGRTPLHVAVESHDPLGSGINSTRVIRLLLENGADAKVKETKCGNTALHLGVSLSSDPGLVRMLLVSNGGEAVNFLNHNKNTPLHMAAAMSDQVSLDVQVNICTNLIRAGGLTNIRNGQGKTPLALVSTERKEYIRHIFQ